mmetsp:Transcript_59089/g.133796  ORF Transcript_59089/g.133796 Transcript_59089/m.133796 type:complete len:247 (-) Transcript_59089:250-990(-)
MIPQAPRKTRSWTGSPSRADTSPGMGRSATRLGMKSAISSKMACCKLKRRSRGLPMLRDCDEKKKKQISDANGTTWKSATNGKSAVASTGACDRIGNPYLVASTRGRMYGTQLAARTPKPLSSFTSIPAASVTASRGVCAASRRASEAAARSSVCPTSMRRLICPSTKVSGVNPPRPPVSNSRMTLASSSSVATVPKRCSSPSFNSCGSTSPSLFVSKSANPVRRAFTSASDIPSARSDCAAASSS